MALRLAGASFSEIAETLGYQNPAMVRDDLEAFLAAQVAPGQREYLRNEEASRIERLMRSVWGKATNPQDPEHIPAVRVAISLIDRHAKLLGLDSPTEVVVYTPAAAEIEQWVADMLSRTTDVYDVVEADIVGELEAGALDEAV